MAFRITYSFRAGLVAAALLGVALFLASCTQAAPPAGSAPPSPDTHLREVRVADGQSYFEVSVAGLEEALQDKDFPLINVHIPYEGEIEPTDDFIAYDEIEEHLDRLPADKDARIVLYCRSDRMSAIAASALAKQGYTDVWHLKGGFVAWQAAGLPLAHK
jgi:rhodanese-related sulfurtransferase